MAPTLCELCALHARLKMLAPPTVARYELCVRSLERFVRQEAQQADPGRAAKSIRPTEITAALLLEYRDHCVGRMRATTVNTERRHLSALFNFAVKRGWMRVNPWHDVPPAPTPHPMPKALDRQDIHAFINYLAGASKLDAKGRRVEALPPQWFWLAVLKTFYYTGMRKRQLVELRWNDLRMDSRTILLRAESSKTRKEWLIPLPEAIRSDLDVLRSRTVEVRGNDIGAHQVFCLPLFSVWRSNFATKQMRADNVDAFFQRLRKCMPVHAPKLSAHRIRHTTATVLANAVPNLKVVQQQLGHASITTTYGYVHPDIAAMRGALDAL